MPTLDIMEIPKPKNWQDFERLVESYAVYANNNKNPVIGNNITIKTPKKLSIFI
ncbi:MAG: hypothetical protein ACOYVK_09305 [Bacillota bacterium]